MLKIKKTIFIACAAFTFAQLNVNAQEALKSAEEEYYDFLALQGLTERNYLNYRTLSDSEWQIKEDAEHPWQDNNLGTKKTVFQAETLSDGWFMRGVDQSVKYKVYGPEWFNSYNTHMPYGQNDGALWQGKGYNTSITAGARLEAYGFEVTFKPQISFSQNKSFDLMPSAYDSPYGYFWGYGRNQGADAPQRFGDDSFWTFDWGDTEIRYTWHNLTAGVGTQAIWLGPAFVNPVLHSNNAATYPKVDVGFRKTEVNIFGHYIGDMEGRIWTGRLTESDYFDNDGSNDHNMFHGLTMSYAPSFLEGLTLGVNRVCLTKWKMKNLKYVLPREENSDVGVQGSGEDQKASFTADWIFPSVGFEVYGEIGIDDFANRMKNFEHTMTYTAGAKKAVRISDKHNISGEIIFEWNNTEMSQDFQLQWPYNFGFHYQVTQGYTNKGQWLGSGIGYGGNSQFLGFKIYHPKGSVLLFINRFEPDSNYIYSKAVEAKANEDNLNDKYYHQMKSHLVLGISSDYFVTSSLKINAGILYDKIYSPYYEDESKEGTWMRNYSAQFGLKYSL